MNLEKPTLGINLSIRFGPNFFKIPNHWFATSILLLLHCQERGSAFKIRMFSCHLKHPYFASYRGTYQNKNGNYSKYICVLYLKLYKARTPFGEIFIHFQSLCVRSVGSWPLRCPVLSFKMNSHPGVIFTLQVILIAISGTQAQGLRILQGIYVYTSLNLLQQDIFKV